MQGTEKPFELFLTDVLEVFRKSYLWKIVIRRDSVCSIDKMIFEFAKKYAIWWDLNSRLHVSSALTN